MMTVELRLTLLRSLDDLLLPCFSSSWSPFWVASTCSWFKARVLPALSSCLKPSFILEKSRSSVAFLGKLEQSTRGSSSLCVRLRPKRSSTLRWNLRARMSWIAPWLASKASFEEIWATSGWGLRQQKETLMVWEKLILIQMKFFLESQAPRSANRPADSSRY